MLIFADSIIGVVLLVIGLIFEKWPPEDINDFVGYRTARSMKNRDTWQEANRYSARLFKWTGLLSVIVGVVCGIFLDFAGIFISMGAAFAAIGVAVYYTEKRLKTLFDENGRRKDQPFTLG